MHNYRREVFLMLSVKLMEKCACCLRKAAHILLIVLEKQVGWKNTMAVEGMS